MKKSFLLNFCLFIFFTVQSQTDWKKWYGETSQQEILVAAEPGADSTHFWATGTIANGQTDDFWLMRLNQQGQKIWSDTLGRPDRNERISDFSRNPATGEMWLVGDSRPSSDWRNGQIFLQKLDAAGQLVFEKLGLFGFVGDYLNHLNIKSVGDGVLIFHQNTGILRRLDALGEVVWERSFLAENLVFNRQNIAVLPDGGCFFTEKKSNSARCVLHRLAADGQTVWQVTLDFPTNLTNGCFPQSVLADPADQSVFVATKGGLYQGIQKFTADGQLIWKTDLSFEPYQNDFLDAWMLQIPAKNRVALFSNHAFQVLDDQTGALIIEENNLDWGQQTDFVFQNDGVLLSDETFAVVGTSNKNAYGYDGYAAKMSADDFQILQENTFGNPSPNDTDSEARVETAADGGYFLANVAYFDTSKTGIALRKINADGTEIWKKGFVGSEGYWNFEMRRAPDGNLFLMGHGNDSIDVLKLNPDGDLLWQRNFKCIGDIATISTSAALKNGGIVVFYPFTTYLPTQKKFYEARAFDANGNEIWKKQIFEDLPSSAYLGMGVNNAEDLGDGTVGAVGSKSGLGAWVARYNLLTGAAIFEKFLPGGSYNFQGIFTTTDGGFLTLEFKNISGVLDSLNLFKINGLGEVVAVKNLPVPAKDFWWISLLFRAPDGNCVVSALSEGKFLDIFKVNDNLDLLDQKTLSLLPNSDWLSGQTMLPDGSFLFCGEGSNGNSHDVFLIKTGKSGIVSSQNLEKSVGFQVFPNPISENQPLQILLENDFFGTVKIEFLSLDGRQLFIFQKEKTAEKQVFEIENLPFENSFFVRISDEKRSAVRLVLKF